MFTDKNDPCPIFPDLFYTNAPGPCFLLVNRRRVLEVELFTDTMVTDTQTPTHTYRHTHTQTHEHTHIQSYGSLI